MGKIFILPDRISNRIAAGEVVEKPASVVKELVENSIDAGAREIEIRIEGNGRKLIQVSDDGCGMDYDDAIISLERHSTSKIKNPEDLESISTLGFRGEALASIASVSRFSLLTRMAEQTVGTKVEAAGGKLLKVEKAARESGTTIKVEELFFNTPARLKFLKSDAVEMRWIIRVLTNYAIVYKNIRFTVFEGGRVLLRVAPAKSLFERIHAISGQETAKALLPFDGNDGDVRAFGYCSHTNHKRSSRDGLHFFVNGRSLDDKLLSSAVTASYKNLIPPGTYPSVFLFIELPYNQVDVNVHPTKMEARFKSPGDLRRLIEESIRAALIKSSPVLNIKMKKNESYKDENSSGARPLSNSVKGFSDYLSEGLPDVKPEKQENNAYKTTVDSGKNRDKTHQIPPIAVPVKQETETSVGVQFDDAQFKRSYRGLKTGWSRTPVLSNIGLDLDSRFIPDLKETNIRVIGQLLNSFILAQGDEDLLIIDQHIAHERIRYEQLKEQYAMNRIESQNLLIPETFEATREDDIALRELTRTLSPLGFQIEPFGNRTWTIKALPVGTETSGEVIVREMLDLFDDMQSTGREGDLEERMHEEMLALIACHGSIKKNMPLTKDKMEWLLTQLALCKEPYRCPHGRPVILSIERDELFKKFGRDIHK